MRRMTKQRVDEMADMDVFRHCDRRELSTLAGALRERAFRADQFLCSTGQPADEVFIVRRGHLLVRVGTDIVATLGTGAIAGELGVLGGSVRSADLVALDDGSVFVASAASLRWALSECQGLRRAITPVLADRAEENSRRLAM